MSKTRRAVLLLAFGGVESLADVEPFLQNITKGRELTSEMVETVKQRYRLIGGKSPLREITLRQAQALQASLEKRKKGAYRVYTGMRYWHPYIQDTLYEIHEAGINKITAIIMTPQQSGYTTEAYQTALKAASNKLTPKPDIRLVCDLHNNRHFLEAVAEKIIAGLASFVNKEKTLVVFSAHSIPLRSMGSKDPYVKQLTETIDGILTITGGFNWKLGYQSKGMMPGVWLEPSVDSIIDGLPEAGLENVLLVPVGFVADHVETLYDIDIVYRKKAESLGLNFNRTLSLNDTPKLINALADVALNHHCDKFT